MKYRERYMEFTIQSQTQLTLLFLALFQEIILGLSHIQKDNAFLISFKYDFCSVLNMCNSFSQTH